MLITVMILSFIMSFNVVAQQRYHNYDNRYHYQSHVYHDYNRNYHYDNRPYYWNRTETNRNPLYRNHHSRFGFIPWVVGGAILFGSIQIPRNQTIYIEYGNVYQRVDTYCFDQYNNRYFCGYQWIQQ